MKRSRKNRKMSAKDSHTHLLQHPSHSDLVPKLEYHSLAKQEELTLPIFEKFNKHLDYLSIAPDSTSSLLTQLVRGCLSPLSIYSTLTKVLANTFSFFQSPVMLLSLKHCFSDTYRGTLKNDTASPSLHPLHSTTD